MLEYALRQSSSASFLLDVLPGGLKRIRHYGVLAKGCKKTQLAQARQALQQPAQNPQATESARDFMARVARIRVNACPCCQAPLKVVQTLPGLKHWPAPGQVQSPTTARGPHGEARSCGPPSEHSLQAVWGELAPKLGATERKACSPSTASQKLRMPSPLLAANLESAGRDAGDNEQHQGGRRFKPPVPTEALPATDSTWFSSTGFICRDQWLCSLRPGWRGR